MPKDNFGGTYSENVVTPTTDGINRWSHATCPVKESATKPIGGLSKIT